MNTKIRTSVIALVTSLFFMISGASFAVDASTNNTVTVQDKFLVVSNPITDLSELNGKTLKHGGKDLVIDTSKWLPDCKVALSFKVTNGQQPETFDGVKNKSGMMLLCPAKSK